MPFLIDSNVLIDVSRGNEAAIKYVDSLPEPWALSQITAMEFIVGARDKRELAVIDGFLSQYHRRNCRFIPAPTESNL